MFVNSHPVPSGTNNKIIERYITQMREAPQVLNNKNLPQSGAKPMPDARRV